MRRTNIYLTDEQCMALDEVARSSSTSRAELIRRLIDRAIGGAEVDTDTDLSAIDASFGALAVGEITFDRDPDARAAHLGRLAGR